jgi:hypothetical protein
MVFKQKAIWFFWARHGSESKVKMLDFINHLIVNTLIKLRVIHFDSVVIFK